MGLIHRTYRNGKAPHAQTRRGDQNFALENETASAVPAYIDRTQYRSRVEPETGLAIGERVTGCPSDPEIRDPVRDVSRSRYFRFFVQARADDDRVRTLCMRTDEPRDVRSIMLSVRVQRDYGRGAAF